MIRARNTLLILAAALLLTPAMSQAQDADAYLDEPARELVRLARLRRQTVDRRIESYAATARERMTVRLRSGIIEKLFYRRQSVVRVEWKRDGPIGMTILGAREEVPAASARQFVPFRRVANLAFDPVDPDALLLLDSTVVRHPLAEGGEVNYRFASGDTTVIRLPDGRTVRMRELRIIPRRRDPQLINGSFWLEVETHAMVQAHFKLARAYDADLDNITTIASLAHYIGVTEDDGDPEEPDEMLPGFMRPIRGDLDFIALEYGFWDLQWWLPRRVVWQGHLQLGKVTFPASYERTYEAFTIRGDTSRTVAAQADSMPQPCRPRIRYSSANAVIDSVRQARNDTLRARRQRFDAMIAQRREAWGGVTPVIRDCAHEIVITADRDSAVIHSSELSVSTDDLALITASELNELADKIGRIPKLPCCSAAPRLQWALTGPGLIRYNRVEGLSLGMRLNFDLAASSTLTTEVRLGIADLDPRGAIALERRGAALETRVAAYRQLTATTWPEVRGGFLSSLRGVLFGRDDDQYFDALGGELVVRPSNARRQWFDVRLYAERQRAVERNTDFSIRHAIDSDQRFPDNFQADAADQLGLRVRLRTTLGLNPAAPQLSGEVTVAGEAGDYTLLRPEALLRLRTPLPFNLIAGVEGAVGTVEGDAVPTQALWRLGGAATLRGYDVNDAVGERYWRARAELGFGVTASRITLFSDAAWVGSRNTFDSRDALYSAGIGTSLWDGLLRIDVARGLRAGRGWKIHVHVNSIL